MNLLTKRLTIPEVVRSTGFTRKEELLLEKAGRISHELERNRNGRKYMIIGGFAIRMYISTEYKGKIGDGRPTDIDLAFLEIPPAIRKQLNEEKLIDRIETRLAASLDAPVRRVSESAYSVFHLKPELAVETPLFDDVCFFEGRIGPIVVTPHDILSARTIEMYLNPGADVTETSIRIAAPAVVLATVLNPAAITETRAKRAILMMASLPREEFAAAMDRYVEIVKLSGIDDIDAIATRLSLMTKKNGFKTKVEEFIDTVKTRLASITT